MRGPRRCLQKELTTYRIGFGAVHAVWSLNEASCTNSQLKRLYVATATTQPEKHHGRLILLHQTTRIIQGCSAKYGELVDKTDV